MKRTLILMVLLFCHVALFASTHVLSRTAKYGAKKSYQATQVAKKATTAVLKAIF